MRLLAEVLRLLQGERVSHALIGAAALAVRGVSRSTADIDLLCVDTRILRREAWSHLVTPGRTLRVLEGDADDPLAGSVRIAEGSEIVDIVVGRHVWEREIIERAEPLSIGELTVPVVRPAGLVLLKLHAGGAKDAWDIRSLLEVSDQPAEIESEVERVIPRLPADARSLWSRLRAEAPARPPGGSAGRPE
jgi:predicted nucleotidyltransferase